MRGKGKLRIWPAYFEIRYTRSEGRRVARNNATRNPKAEDIERVAENLGLNPILQPGKKYCKQPWRSTGVVLVDSTAPKSEIIHKIAGSLRG